MRCLGRLFTGVLVNWTGKLMKIPDFKIKKNKAYHFENETSLFKFKLMLTQPVHPKYTAAGHDNLMYQILCKRK